MSECKVIVPQECFTGNHRFVISNWLVTPQAQKANAWTCSKCLHTVEGSFSINELREAMHADAKARAVNSPSNDKNPGSKSDKDSDRKTQKAG